MKRIISTAMATLLALSSVSAVSADEAVGDKTTFYSSVLKLDKNRDIYSFMERFPDEIKLEVTDSESASGSYSLYIDSKGAYDGKTLDAGDAEQYFGNTAESGFTMSENMKANTEYTFSVKIKIGEGGSLGNIRVMQTGQTGFVSKDKVPPYYFMNQMEKTEGEDGWITYTKTFNTLSNNGLYLHFIAGGAENVYVDDLYFKDNTNNKVLIDYDFEDVVFTDMYKPTGIEVLTENYGEMEISWRNPMNYNNTGWAESTKIQATSPNRESGILNISLYDVTESADAENEDISVLEPIVSINKGEADFEQAELNTKPNEISSCLLKNLESNKEYKFILAVTTDKTNEDGTTDEVVTKTLVTGTTLEIPEDWRPELETVPNFHHIVPVGFMNDAAETNDPSINIAFWNPKADNIQEITLDRIIDGDCVRVEGTNFSLKGNAVNEHEINGLVKGEKYQFKLNCTFSDGTTQSAVFDATAGMITRPSTINGWVPHWSVGTHENNASVVRMDTTEKHSGESSVYISTSLPQAASNRYIMLQCNGIAFKADSTYKVTFWAKANNCSYIRFYAGWPNASRLVQYTDITDEWGYHEVYLKNLTAAANQLLIITDNYCEDLWIDDITVTLDGDSKNLISNGECEVDGSTELEAVLKIKSEAQDGKVKLTWTNALEAITSYVDIYDISGEKKSFKGRYTESEAVVYDLINENIHTLEIIPVDANGREGKSATVDVMPTAPDYALLNPHFEKDGKSISEITPGVISGVVSVKNKNMGDNFKVTLVAALYDGYKMIASNISTNEIGVNTELRDGEKISVDIEVPEASEEKDYKLKFFMWDSAEEKNILRECRVLGE